LALSDTADSYSKVRVCNIPVSAPKTWLYVDPCSPPGTVLICDALPRPAPRNSASLLTSDVLPTHFEPTSSRAFLVSTAIGGIVCSGGRWSHKGRHQAQEDQSFHAPNFQLVGNSSSVGGLSSGHITSRARNVAMSRGYCHRRDDRTVAALRNIVHECEPPGLSDELDHPFLVDWREIPAERSGPHRRDGD
jgi:hypothetical protein